MPLRQRYEQFHGHAPRRRDSWDFHVPRGLVKLGKAIAVEYETDKLNGGGDGTVAVYRHEFETPCYVCMDERGRRQLYIVGRNLKVSEAGIEN